MMTSRAVTRKTNETDVYVSLVMYGVQGNADDAVNALLSGNLAYDPDARCDHHDHQEDHECGNHGCGGNCHE